MNCHDFHQFWNDRLDAGYAFKTESLADALRHEQACDDCRRLASGYRALAGLLPLAAKSELPSASCADRVLEKLAAERDSRFGFRPQSFGTRLAIAATLLLSLTAGLLVRFNTTGDVEKQARSAENRADSRSLSLALAEASKATWAFARDTSAPAARVGTDVLGVSDSAEAAPRLSFSLPMDLTVKVDSSSEALRDIGKRVNNGVRPLSGTARAAFGFLLGTPPNPQSKINEPGSGA